MNGSAGLTVARPDDAAFLILGLVQGLAIRWSISGRSFDLAEEGSRLLDLQLRGFADRPVRVRREEAMS